MVRIHCFSLLLLHIYVREICIHVMITYLCVCICMHGLGLVGVRSEVDLPLCIEVGVSHLDPELASLPVGSGIPSLCLLSWNDRQMTTPTWYLCGYWGYKL